MPSIPLILAFDYFLSQSWLSLLGKGFSGKAFDSFSLFVFPLEQGGSQVNPERTAGPVQLRTRESELLRNQGKEKHETADKTDFKTRILLQ